MWKPGVGSWNPRRYQKFRYKSLLSLSLPNGRLDEATAGHCRTGGCVGEAFDHIKCQITTHTLGLLAVSCNRKHPPYFCECVKERDLPLARSNGLQVFFNTYVSTSPSALDKSMLNSFSRRRRRPNSIPSTPPCNKIGTNRATYIARPGISLLRTPCT